jgi:hypothetical protein
MDCAGAALQSKICGLGVEAECAGAALSVSGFGTDSWIVFNKLRPLNFGYSGFRVLIQFLGRNPRFRAYLTKS